jgi:UDP-N-acetylglucosamine 2-epimerase (non-hydrolysing)
MKRKVLLVFGTRPEAIKLCPLVIHLLNHPSLEPKVCVTAQHRHMLDAILGVFGVRPDHDLDVMRANQTLSSLTARILEGLEGVLSLEKPDFLVVQGDTTSTMAGALASFYHRVPVGHVEAGLRTGDLAQPFPEELNRVLTTRLASLHFAPTERAATNLRADGVEESRISVTGNTGIDALLYTRDKLDTGEWRGYEGQPAREGRRLILMTAHRRESFGEGFERICDAVLGIAERTDVEVVYPVHPNPNVRSVVEARLGGHPRVSLIPPLDYVPFVDLMMRAEILLTDSGGIQEEGPSLGKPVLVMRDKTERQEAVEAGTARLVGTDPARIVEFVSQLLDNHEFRESMKGVRNPFGDGLACPRIASAISSFLSK